MTDSIKPQGATSASDLPPRGMEVKKASEGMPAGDFGTFCKVRLPRRHTQGAT